MAVFFVATDNIKLYHILVHREIYGCVFGATDNIKLYYILVHGEINDCF